MSHGTTWGDPKVLQPHVAPWLTLHFLLKVSSVTKRIKQCWKKYCSYQINVQQYGEFENFTHAILLNTKMRTKLWFMYNTLPFYLGIVWEVLSEIHLLENITSRWNFDFTTEKFKVDKSMQAYNYIIISLKQHNIKNSNSP